MIKPFTKPVIIDPYYDCPIWIDNEITRKEYIILSADSIKEDVELFLILLFGYNGIDVMQSLEKSFNDLFNADEVALSGGIAFFGTNNKKILPSCCCGLEDWHEVYDSIINKSSPWLGHDPTPGITYPDRDIVRIWSNDPESIAETKEKPYFIEFNHEELLKSLETAKDDLRNFIKEPLFKWIYRRNNRVGKEMTVRMDHWFKTGMMN